MPSHEPHTPRCHSPPYDHTLPYMQLAVSKYVVMSGTTQVCRWYQGETAREGCREAAGNGEVGSAEDGGQGGSLVPPHTR